MILIRRLNKLFPIVWNFERLENVSVSDMRRLVSVLTVEGLRLLSVSWLNVLWTSLRGPKMW